MYLARFLLPPAASGRHEDVPDLPLLALLFGELHREARGGAYALGFPCWRDPAPGRPGSFGRVLDVFAAEPSVLDTLLMAKRVARLARDHCSLVGPQRVPSALLQGYAQFRRTRCQDRVSPAAIRRMLGQSDPRTLNSLAGRVRLLAEEGMTAEEIAQRLRRADEGAPHLHYRTTHTGFVTQIAVSRTSVQNAGDFLFTSFGLSRGGAVPVVNPEWGR